MTDDSNDSMEYPTNPAKECDFVMKGGITSGVVYPPSILELQKEFRFRSVGGTSAGAIAAALTAAAELGRCKGGFKRLGEKSKELSQGKNLLNLFAPQELTKPLMEMAIHVFMEGSKPPDGANESRLAKLLRYLRRARAGFRQYLPAAVWKGRQYGAAAGVLFVLVFLLPAAVWLAFRGVDATTWWRLAEAAGVTALAGLTCGVLFGGFIAPVVRLAQIALRLPSEGFFGLSVGFEGEKRKEVLTTWLADAIDYVAGRDLGKEPLTFAHLRANTAPGEDGRKDASITLRMVTSNLSHREPYLLPFDERKIFLFREDDMKRFFPQRVVGYLKSAAPEVPLPLPAGFYFLPEGDKLPVIVATRLSLSFPFLLCAIPLYTIRRTAFQEKDQVEKAGHIFKFDADTHFQKNWFSDGGISSNFPIHFFDAWSPLRPTLGVNLMDVPEGAKRNGMVAAEQYGTARDDDSKTGDVGVAGDIEEVYLPRANETGWPQWNPVDGLPAFVGAIFNTAQNFRDNMQTRLPSYRERIVQIRLQPHEGGLNLTMTPETIKGIEAKGTRAGVQLGSLDFEQHRWVRFLVLMAQLEKGLFQLGEALTPQDVDQLFKSAARLKWYRQDKWSPNRQAEALSRMEKLLALISGWKDSSHGPVLFSENPPKPESVLRIAPPI